MGALLLIFFQEQVVRSPVQQRSAGAPVRAYVEPAPRGLILDRHGAVLAETTTGYALSLAPMPPNSARRAMDQLAPYLDLPDEEVAALLARQRRRPAQRLVISPDVPVDLMIRIAERRAELSGVEIEEWPKRHYPAGAVAAHVVGTVGVLEPARGAGRSQGARVSAGLAGATGVELSYDRWLAGRDGLGYRELDARGRAVRPVALRWQLPALPGETLGLTLDLKLQQAIAEAVPAGTRAAVVALDPGTGELLALYSSPSFDPNQVAGPAFPERWAELMEREGNPGLGRAVSGTYRPGSIWGVTTALTAVHLGLADAGTAMPLPCRGGLSFADRYLPCHDRRGHGALTLRDAVLQGCDVFFYQLGLKIGLDRLLREGTRLGLGRATGVDLPDERAAVMPADSVAYARRLGVAPSEHEAMLVAAGQGVIEVSPLKLAHLVAALVTDGPVPAPRLLRQGGAGDDAGALEVRLAPEEREWLRDVLEARGVTRPATSAASRPASAVGADGGRLHDWFVGVAERPTDGARLVVAVVVEVGGSAPAAAGIGGLALDRFLLAAAAEAAPRSAP
jgi:penicillin-binding protein 2